MKIPMDFDEAYPVYFRVPEKDAKFIFEVMDSDWEKYLKAQKIVDNMQEFIHNQWLEREVSRENARFHANR